VALDKDEGNVKAQFFCALRLMQPLGKMPPLEKPLARLKETP
jgi:hypothetical protein